MKARSSHTGVGNPRQPKGRTAVWQARLAILIMINLAQLWILSAVVEASLAREFKQLVPLIVASAVVFINIAAYLVLVLLLLIRIIRYFPRVLADIGDHVRGPGFFTVVAGTCVLGSQLIIVAGQFEAAKILWFVGLVLWAVVMY